MKIKSRRNFIIAIISTILAVTCLAILFTAFEFRFVITSLFLFIYAIINFILAFSKRGILEEIGGVADERDKFIAMKSGHLTLKILNYVLSTACFISIVLYGAFKNTIFLSSAILLCSIIVLMFIIMLAVNIYYEKNR